MSDAIQIVPAREEHATEIVTVMRSGLAETVINATIYGCSGIAEFIRYQISVPHKLSDTVYTVALAGQRVLGCVELRCFPHALFLNYISVLPQFRKKGLGRQLLTAAIKHANLQARANMLLDVLEDNAIAKSWYERLGFRHEHAINWWDVRLENTEQRIDSFVSGSPECEVCQRAFGFSHFRVVTSAGEYIIGRLGQDWFRVTQPEAIEDRTLMGTLARLDSDRHVLVITHEDRTPRVRMECGRHIARFRRMSVDLSMLRDNLSGKAPFPEL